MYGVYTYVFRVAFKRSNRSNDNDCRQKIPGSADFWKTIGPRIETICFCPHRDTRETQRVIIASTEDNCMLRINYKTKKTAIPVLMNNHILHVRVLQYNLQHVHKLRCTNVDKRNLWNNV